MLTSTHIFHLLPFILGWKTKFSQPIYKETKEWDSLGEFNNTCHKLYDVYSMYDLGLSGLKTCLHRARREGAAEGASVSCWLFRKL